MKDVSAFEVRDLHSSGSVPICKRTLFHLVQKQAIQKRVNKTDIQKVVIVFKFYMENLCLTQLQNIISDRLS